MQEVEGDIGKRWKKIKLTAEALLANLIPIELELSKAEGEDTGGEHVDGGAVIESDWKKEVQERYVRYAGRKNSDKLRTVDVNDSREVSGCADTEMEKGIFVVEGFFLGLDYGRND